MQGCIVCWWRQIGLWSPFNKCTSCGHLCSAVPDLECIWHCLRDPDWLHFNVDAVISGAGARPRFGQEEKWLRIITLELQQLRKWAGKQIINLAHVRLNIKVTWWFSTFHLSWRNENSIGVQLSLLQKLKWGLGSLFCYRYLQSNESYVGLLWAPPSKSNKPLALAFLCILNSFWHWLSPRVITVNEYLSWTFVSLFYTLLIGTGPFLNFWTECIYFHCI